MVLFTSCPLLMWFKCYAELQNELEQMSVAQPMIYQPLCEVVEVSHFNCKIISGVSLLITFYYWVFYVFRD